MINRLIIALVAVVLVCSCTGKPKAAENEGPKTVEGIVTEAWKGNSPISWETGKFVHIPATQFDTLSIGDELVVNFDFIGDDAYPMVALFDDEWADLTCSGRIWIDSTMTHVSYFVSKHMAETIHKGGIIAAGVAYNLTSIEIHKHDITQDLSHTIWFGNFQMADDWQNPLNLSAKTFANANPGDILRIHFIDVKETAELSLHTGQWRIIQQGIPVTNAPLDYVLNEEILHLFQIEAFTLNGHHFGIDKIEIIPTPNKE